jgi:hypothetical protein
MCMHVHECLNEHVCVCVFVFSPDWHGVYNYREVLGMLKRKDKAYAAVDARQQVCVCVYVCECVTHV